ncbi:MAG: glutamine--fructose-6-phosphate transaminase (isomerizing) [Candidatus Bipolaricaulia bacterium]
MCGIIGYVGHREAKAILMEGLKRLEYRGYDSAGIVVLEDGTLWMKKQAGKIVELERATQSDHLEATIGLGHTRWATHGTPTDHNAHPHQDCSEDLAIVHNGIIENYATLKRTLQENGHRFTSDTDTEVLAHLFEEYSDRYGNLEEAVRHGLEQIEGAFAFAVISKRSPAALIVARRGSPLVLGLGDGENFAASDVSAFLEYTRDMVALNDGEMAIIRRDGVRILDVTGSEIERHSERIDWDPVMAQKQGYRHFMLKEIHEQPKAVRDTLLERISLNRDEVLLDLDLPESWLDRLENIYLLACGTSWHAGLVAKYIWEDFLQVPIETEIGSEFRYRHPYISDATLAVAISQSGETADTLAGMRMARERGARIISIPNVVGSTITRESDGLVYTHAGPEIGVASTKAFTAQLTALILLGLHLGRRRGEVSEEQTRETLEGLVTAPALLEGLLSQEERIEALARDFFDKRNFLYLGRDILHPIALEGALKLKEISYIHAEGYPAGEMKHGPIALIDEDMPVVVLVTRHSVYDKVFANIEEIKARKGQVIAFTDVVNPEIERIADRIFKIPETTCEYLTPMLFTIPLQLLAYHIAVLRGTDVDQPRNLAKSVTVE